MPARIRSATSTARAQVARLDEDLAAAPEDNRRLREDKLELQKEKDQMRKQRNEALTRAQKAEKLLQEKTAKINHQRKLLKAAENKNKELEATVKELRKNPSSENPNQTVPAPGKRHVHFKRKELKQNRRLEL